MKKVVLLIIVLGLIAWLGLRSRTDAPTPEPSTQTAQLVDPTFTWSYRSFEQNEFPKTEITLTARGSDGAIQTKIIDSPDGSCNDYYKPDADVYKKSTMIICYAAGLGHYYKIVQSDGNYLVQRKTFEEGSPEYTPPDRPFEPIARF